MATNEMKNGCRLSIEAVLDSNHKRRCVFGLRGMEGMTKMMSAFYAKRPFAREGSQKLFAKTRADRPDEFGLLAFVKTDQQSAEMFPGPFGLGITANHEFLLLVELVFEPYLGAFAGFVTGARGAKAPP